MLSISLRAKRELNNNWFPVITILAISHLLAGTARAVCPVCVVAVGAGLGLSRWLGIDDTITGAWLGGLTLAMILWTINWLNKKNFHFPAQGLLTFLGYYVLIFVSLRWIDVIGHPLNTIWGIDKLVFGIILGSIFFAAGNYLYSTLKKRNNNRAYFPFQKVVMPVGTLLILSFILYLFIN